MLFMEALAIQIVTEMKRQTRRIQKIGETYLDAPHKTVFTGNKIKWQVGRDYAVQTRRGGCSLSKFNLLNIRSEPACDISDADAIAEGFTSRDEFLSTWVKINGKDSLSKQAWVLDIKPLFVVGQNVKLAKCTYADMRHIPLGTIGTLELGVNPHRLFWLNIDGRRYDVPISWLSPVADN